MKTLSCSDCGSKVQCHDDTTAVRCGSCVAGGQAAGGKVEPLLRDPASILGDGAIPVKWPTTDKARKALAYQFSLCLAAAGAGHLRVLNMELAFLDAFRLEDMRTDPKPGPLGRPLYPRSPLVTRLVELRDKYRSAKATLNEMDVANIGRELSAEGFVGEDGKPFTGGRAWVAFDAARAEVATWLLGCVFERDEHARIVPIQDDPVEWRDVPLSTELPPVTLKTWAERESLDDSENGAGEQNDARKGDRPRAGRVQAERPDRGTRPGDGAGRQG